MAGYIIDSSGSGQGQVAGCCKRGNETSGLHTMRGTSGLAEDLLASEGLYEVIWIVIYKNMSNLAVIVTFIRYSFRIYSYNEFFFLP